MDSNAGGASITATFIYIILFYLFLVYSILPLHLPDLKVMKFDNVTESGYKKLRNLWSNGQEDGKNNRAKENCSGKTRRVAEIVASYYTLKYNEKCKKAFIA